MITAFIASVIRFGFGCLSRGGVRPSMQTLFWNRAGTFSRTTTVVFLFPFFFFFFFFKCWLPSWHFWDQIFKSCCHASLHCCSMNLVGGRKRRQTLMSFTKRLFSAKANCFNQIRREDSFPSPSVSGEGSVSECMVVIVVCCFPKKSMTSDGDDEDKFSPLVVPRFLMKTVFVRRPGKHVGGRDGWIARSRPIRTESDRPFCYLSSHCSKKKTERQIFFFSPLRLFLSLPKDVTFVKLAAQIFSAVVAPPPRIRKKTHEMNGREVCCF